MDNKRKHLTLECEVCSSVYQQQERVYKNSKWKNRCPSHRKEIFKCVDCGCEVFRGSTRCKVCSNKDRAKERPTCVDCGCEIGLKATRCRECHNIKQDRGLSKERTKFNVSKEWSEVRTQCFERDDYTCQVCNVRGSQKLECHHVIQWKDNEDKRLELDNLLTVCYDCHKYIHFGKHKRS